MKPSILYVTHRLPLSPDRDDRTRSWNILKFLSQHAHVDLITLADERLSGTTLSALQSVTRRLAIIPHSGVVRFVRGLLSLSSGRTLTEGWLNSPRLANTVRHWNVTTRYAAALASSAGVARYILEPFAPSVDRAWIDLIDLESRRWLNDSTSSGFPVSLVYGREGRRLRHQEVQLAKMADRVLVVSEAERHLFRGLYPEAPVHVVGNGVDADFFTPLKSQVVPHSCVFVGGHGDRLESRAVRCFLQTVWPQIWQRFPGSTFRVVTRNPGPGILRLQEFPGVSVVGSVTDVRPWLNESHCVVVPPGIDRDLQHRVLQGMACGRPVVCSSLAAGELRVESGLQLLQADSADEWVAGITAVFSDQHMAHELGIAAAAWVQIHHLWDCCLEPLTEMLDADSYATEQEIGIGP